MQRSNKYPFFNSRISANHVKVDGLSANGEIHKKGIVLYCRICFDKILRRQLPNPPMQTKDSPIRRIVCKLHQLIPQYNFTIFFKGKYLLSLPKTKGGNKPFYHNKLNS